MKTIVSLSVVLLLVISILAACVPQEIEKPMDQVTVQLVWAHSAVSAGFYVAEQRGYYAAENLDVTLLPRANIGVDIVAPVVDGTADFGVDLGAGVITARSKGKPVTAIATIYRRYALAFITLASSGITRPQDFPGHTVRTLHPGGSAIAMRAMMNRLGLDADSVRQVDVGFDLAPFFAGEVDIVPGNISGIALQIRAQGYDVNLILPGDYGIHLYGDTLFTTDRLIKENPDLVLRFLRATLQGWQWAVENPEDAGMLALEYDRMLDAAHMRAAMNASAPLIHTGEDHIGWMSADMWEGMEQILLEQKLLDEPADLDRVYTMEFLHQIYGNEDK